MSVLETAIGWLAPPQCVGCGEEGVAICSQCAARLAAFGPRCWRCNCLSPDSRTCATCRGTGSPRRVYIYTDYDGLARELLSVYKFGHQRSAAPAISKLMALSFQGQEAALDYDYLAPIPTATGRVRERGFDHTSLLSRDLSHKLKLPRRQVLRRLGQVRQLGSRREQRLVQLSGNFAVKDPNAVAGKRILLIDDVITTGGTLIAATGALRKAGAARVDALLFAKRL